MKLTTLYYALVPFATLTGRPREKNVQEEFTRAA